MMCWVFDDSDGDFMMGSYCCDELEVDYRFTRNY